MLDTRRLTIFCVVAAEGSLTAAATRLHFTQSAVSQQMAILEREVGTPLLERLPRGVRLTSAGAVLAERAGAVLGELSAIERELRRLGDRPEPVTLGTFSTAGAHLIPLVVSAYRERHDDTRLVVVPSQPDDVAVQLTEGSVDVALLWDYDFAPRSMPRLHREHLLDDPLYVLLPTGHPLAGPETMPLRLADLAHEAWIARAHKAPYDQALECMGRLAGFEPDVAFRTPDYESVQGLVAAGIGVGLVPRLSLTARRPDVVARPVHQPAFVRHIDAVTRPDGPADPAVARLLAVLHEIAATVSARAVPLAAVS
ncbi:MAG TPA: LysR family transcriptional regulator [Mycobacteriales bacterium]|nr:LysR family transcriptional regulator [Mycobacteriales bacterium]